MPTAFKRERQSVLKAGLILAITRNDRRLAREDVGDTRLCAQQVDQWLSVSVLGDLLHLKARRITGGEDVNLLAMQGNYGRRQGLP